MRALVALLILEFPLISSQGSPGIWSENPGVNSLELLEDGIILWLIHSETHKLYLMPQFSTVLKVMCVISTVSLQAYTWQLLFRASSAYPNTPPTKHRGSL